MVKLDLSAVDLLSDDEIVFDKQPVLIYGKMVLVNQL